MRSRRNSSKSSQPKQGDGILDPISRAEAKARHARSGRGKPYYTSPRISPEAFVVTAEVGSFPDVL